MFTDCPECSRQFRILARHLSAAKGLVKCGYCGSQFNALDRLYDAPLPENRIQSGESRDTLRVQSNDDFDEAFKITSGEVEYDESVRMGIEMDKAPPQEEETESDITLPQALIDEAPVQPGGLSRLIWSVSVLLLVIIGALQIAWFNRDEVLSRYPVLTPWVRQLCDRLPCEVIRGRDVTAIKLINRDVREHPRYQNTLLVNATMANRSGTAQPFPRVQLALFDTDGKLIGHRIFEPGEYLDESIDLVTGMEPDMPVHFVLEVVRPPESAVSFEFRFL